MSITTPTSDDGTTPSPALAVWALATVWGFICGIFAGWVIWS